MEIERIAIEADTPGAAFSLRVLRFPGSGQGPDVYIQAALHAHEIPGVVALDRLIPRLHVAESENRLRGTVTLVPHANPVGLGQAIFGETMGRFDFNSRTNFNRGFPGQAPESLVGKAAAERLKAELLSLACQSRVVLDLHCDDEGPVYLYVLERQLQEGRRLARAIGAAVILTERDTSFGSFDLSVAERWKTLGTVEAERFAATVELRGLADVGHTLAEQDAEGLYRFMVEIGTIHDELPPRSAAEPVTGQSESAELLAVPMPGAVLYDVNVGDWVKNGQRLACVIGEPGEAAHDLRAPFDGIVMTRLDRRFVRRGDPVIKVLRHPLPDAIPGSV